jgi:hypothetical protein
MNPFPSAGLLGAIAEQRQRELHELSRLWKRSGIARDQGIEDTGLYWTDVKLPTWVRVPCLHHRSGGDKQLTSADSPTPSRPAYQA